MQEACSDWSDVFEALVTLRPGDKIGPAPSIQLVKLYDDYVLNHAPDFAHVYPEGHKIPSDPPPETATARYAIARVFSLFLFLALRAVQKRRVGQV
jgi:hypothetical protein